MPVVRSIVNTRSATLVSALLLSTAFTVPAFAQIETVVVTAEKKAEDLQTVPIAVTALSGAMLKDRQIMQVKDLQFNVPNLTFSKTSLGSGSIHLRGIGPGFFSPGIAQYQDGVYTETADLATGQYYDIASLEILRGPQGTLYGRGSVGGTVNLISAKPDLDNYTANAEVTYGEYNTVNSDGAVNVPIIEGKLGLRVAASFQSHDGLTKNFGTGGNYNSLNDYSYRASLRWQPTDSTTLDLVGSYFDEADSRTRIDNTLCHRDPTGVLGCLPDSLALQPVNTYSRTDSLFASHQFFGSIGALTGGGFIAPAIFGTAAGATTAGALSLLGGLSGPQAALAIANNTGLPANFPVFAGLIGLGYANIDASAGIADVTVANGPHSGFSTAGLIPQNLLAVNSSAPTHTQGFGFSASAHLHQKIADWLDADLVVGTRQGKGTQFGSYTTQPDEEVGPALDVAVSNLFNRVMPMYIGDTPARQASLAATFFGHSTTLTPTGNPFPGPFWTVAGVKIPLSNPQAAGSINEATGVRNYSSLIQVNDKTFAQSRESSGELRFQTNFTGPFNVTTGMYYWERQSPIAAYRVTFNGGDYGSAFLGQTLGSFLPSSIAMQGSEPSYFQQAPTRDTSEALFADATYVVIPDLLNVKAGIRWSQDVHTITNNQASFVSLQPGTPNATGTCLAGAFCFLPITTSAGAAAGTMAAAVSDYPNVGEKSVDTSRIDFRGIVEYSPKLSFTDQTFIYASISRGSKPGNSNLVPATAPPGAIPPFYAPEELTDTELGLKNTLFDGELQANLTGWYYRYKSFQYPSVAYSTSFTQNLNAHMWGGEGEFIWTPFEGLLLNLNATESGSSIGNSFAVDQRNIIAGDPNGIAIKDTVLTTTGDVPGQTCAIYATPAAAAATPAEDPAVTAAYGGVNPFIVPPGGSAQLAAFGVAHVNFGVCGSTNSAILNPLGYFYYGTGPTVGTGDNTSGKARSLKGNPVPDLPTTTISVGAQYTWNVFDGYTLVPRLDYYWQSGLQQRVFNDPVDNISSWDQLNLQVQLNSPDSVWFAKVFATNVADKRNIQGQGLQSDTSGLATNVFLENPRVIGVTLGAHY